MSLPQVISEDSSAIVAEMVAAWESATNKTLQPAQIERLMIDLIAYRESLVRAGVNDAARQGLVDFARDPLLSYLGARVNTFRRQANPSKTTLRYSVEESVTSAFAIPDLPRISAPTGTLFVPSVEPVIQPGQTYVDVVAFAEDAGSAHNGLLPGSIKDPFDELPDGVSVSNVTTSNGGTEREDIERFRERIKLAQARPSAGSDKQYIYLAKSTSTLVVDVSVQIVAPGHVRLALLVDGDPTEIVAAVDKVVRQDDNRPTTDNVDVVAAEAVAVPLTVTIIPRKTALVSSVEQNANSALKSHALKCGRTLGYDIVGSEVATLVQSTGGIKEVLVDGATGIDPAQYAVMTWTVQILEAQDD